MWQKLIWAIQDIHPRVQGFAAGVLLTSAIVWAFSDRYETLTFQMNGFTRETIVRVNRWTGSAEHIADSDPRTPNGPP
jgi:hypothetical protein